jgi:phosphatidylethanolamine/phosphatidyl-N-methylethanolamine N-methyltransferase
MGGMRRRIRENAVFFREFLRNVQTTGAILPSGRYLASALTRFVGQQSAEGRSILEVGPGTGAVTRRIVDCLGPSDQLDMVELNETFVRQLRGRFQTEPAFQRVSARSRVLHCPVEELPRHQGYQVIVSGLPLNNFSVADVEHILAALVELLAPGGILSLFEYIAVRQARAIISGRAERARLRGIGQTLRGMLDAHEIRRDAVWWNVPPAWVHHVRK